MRRFVRWYFGSAWFPFTLLATFVYLVASSAMAQNAVREPGQRPSAPATSAPNPLTQAAQAQGQRPRVRTPAQPAQIQQQQGGAFPDFSRSSVPLGAINQQWADQCGQENTTVAVAHRLDSEIRFRVRQLLGTVVTFPEPVSVVTSPGGTSFTHEAHGDDPKKSNVWVFGATNSGIDGNYVFVGATRNGVPTMYLMRVQAEGYNTEHCPDLLVLIKPSTSPALANAASAMQEWVSAMQFATDHMPPAEVGRVPTPKRVLAPETANSDASTGTGRGGTDWLQGREYDPSNLDFRWTVRSPDGDRADFIAPDIVYSDCCNTYIQFSEDRADQVRLAAIHAVEPTGGGDIDTPVNWTFRGRTIVVQGIQKLTMEREGIVVCIDPHEDLRVAPAEGLQQGDNS